MNDYLTPAACDLWRALSAAPDCNWRLRYSPAISQLVHLGYLSFLRVRGGCWICRLIVRGKTIDELIGAEVDS